MDIFDRNILTKKLKTTAIAAARTAFLIIGIASTAIILASIAVPYSADLLSSSLPRIRTLAFAWLSPSYLFIAVHFIIIIIWKLHDQNYHPPVQNEDEMQFLSKPSEIPCANSATEKSVSDYPDSAPDPPDSEPEPPGSVAAVADPPDSEPDSRDSGADPADSGGTDLDATWKAIVEKGAAAAEAAAWPRMRKSDTWEKYGRDRVRSPPAITDRKFRKSETFRRVSVGKEELFGQAEAFIRTHYEQRRIQRQESEQRYFEMVNAAC